MQVREILETLSFLENVGSEKELKIEYDNLFTQSAHILQETAGKLETELKNRKIIVANRVEQLQTELEEIKAYSPAEKRLEELQSQLESAKIEKEVLIKQNLHANQNLAERQKQKNELINELRVLQAGLAEEKTSIMSNMLQIFSGNIHAKYGTSDPLASGKHSIEIRK